MYLCLLITYFECIPNAKYQPNSQHFSPTYHHLLAEIPRLLLQNVRLFVYARKNCLCLLELVVNRIE
jgi:hypothetical protein